MYVCVCEHMSLYLSMYSNVEGRKKRKKDILFKKKPLHTNIISLMILGFKVRFGLMQKENQKKRRMPK